MQIERVIFLGSGDAFSAEGRHQAGYVVETSSGSLLLDCGATTVISLQKLKISAAPIDAILISHFHGDHIAGLPFLFLHYLYVEPRVKPLEIIGPPGVESRVKQIFSAMYADTAAAPLPFEIVYLEVEDNRQIAMDGKLDGLSIEPFRVPHQENPPSFGFDIRSEEQKLVYTGDTGWTEDLLIRARNADLFICECSFFDTRLDTHMDYLRIKEHANDFGAKRIVLTHLGSEVLDRKSEIDIDLAHDGLIVNL
jgi:ribonuclease BN (tRNA processing enzyme)